MEWEDRDIYTGCLPSPEQHGPLPSSPTMSSGSKASKSSLKVVTSIGNLSVDSQRSSHYEVQSPPGPPPRTWKLPALQQLNPTCGRKTPECPSPSSSLDLSPSIRRAKLTGKWFGKPQQVAESWKFPLISVFNITGKINLIVGPSEQLVVTSRSLLRILEPAMSTGVLLELVNLEELGKKPRYQLTVRVQDLSSGMGTKVKSVLSSMNFVEVSMSRTCSDGLIAIQYVWKSKVLQCRYL